MKYCSFGRFSVVLSHGVKYFGGLGRRRRAHSEPTESGEDSRAENVGRAQKGFGILGLALPNPRLPA